MTAGATKQPIDAELEPGGQISGRLTDVATGAPIEGNSVCAFALEAEPASFGGCTESGAGGEYTVSGLSGSYVVEFLSGGGYLQQFYGESESDAALPVTVASGETRSGIDAALQLEDEAPSDRTVPTIAGSPSIGATLSCSTGAWNGTPPLAFAYQWLRGGIPIAGASSSAYAVQTADGGGELRCRVSALNSDGRASAVSAAVVVPAPLAAGPSPGPAAVAVAAIAATQSPAPGVLSLSSRGGAVYARLDCGASSGSCEAATIELTIVEHLRGSHLTAVTAAHGGTRKVTVVIGKTAVSMPAGQTRTVKVPLNSTGRKLLLRERRLPVRVLVRAGTATLRASNVTVSEPAKKG